MSLSSIAQKRLFILGSFVVLLLAVLLYWRINALVGSFQQIDHANKVENNLQRVLTYLIDAENGHRGYLLTEDSAFLEPYIEARRNIGGVMNRVAELIEKNPDQQQNFSWLQTLINQRFILLELVLTKRNTAPDTLRQYLFRGRASMDRIRTQINHMTLVERTILNQREHQKELYVRLTPISLLFLVFAMLLIIGFSYYGLTKQLQQTKKYASDLDYLNHELLLKNRQLENSVEELNSFNYIASHDLKEPLRKILFFTDVLSNGEHQVSGTARPYLDKIHVAGERMKSLLDDLLTYAKAGMTERHMEPVDLNALLHTVVESLSEMLKEKRAQVVYENLPQVQAIPSQMEQLFENLTTNAVKYSREGVAPYITISSSHISKQELPAAFEATQEWYHCIRFSDNGIGFSQENADKVFVLFQRLHQRHEFSGTGIGLTICKKIVQNHNGFITATSEPGKGSTFTIYLPA